jgi:MoaA/NifB/PqqE/SkfB family radical SAM enzyme
MASIHSPDPDTHDALTGIPGSFEAACTALKLCRELRLVAAFNTVLSEEEVRNDGLAKLMDFARSLDCDYVQLIHPKPAGVWMGREEGMQLDEKLIKTIQHSHLRYNSPAMKEYPSLAAQVFEESSEILGCTSGGVDRFYVGARGEVQPCEFLNISFGNVNDEPFDTIFQRMRSFFRIPGCDWLCCTQAGAIHKAFQEHELKETPMPWKITQGLVGNWEKGEPTPAYRKLGIYR